MSAYTMVSSASADASTSPQGELTREWPQATYEAFGSRAGEARAVYTCKWGGGLNNVHTGRTSTKALLMELITISQGFRESIVKTAVYGVKRSLAFCSKEIKHVPCREMCILERDNESGAGLV